MLPTLLLTETACKSKAIASTPVKSDRFEAPLWLEELSRREWKGDSMEYLGRHSHSFRYAAKFLPEPYGTWVADIYAFCRFTDDLVDRAESKDVNVLNHRLDQWLELAKWAYEGETIGIPFLDRPIHTMKQKAIPFRYAAELIEGVRMDLTQHRYTTLNELEVYTFRVASVVGLWLTELVGQRHPDVLRHAADLGHAMQLTNILRDVGEDLRMGRVYLPMSRLAAHGLSTGSLIKGLADPHLIPSSWPELMEELMALADARYQSALKGIPHLPSFFRKPVLTATLVYRDIHRSLRLNQYDNFHRRAFSPKWRKVVLGLKAQSLLPFLMRQKRGILRHTQTDLATVAA
jgi:15-cis-phytoene synthase